MALRAIVVSGRAALLKTSEPRDREAIRDRVTELLARLEDAVIRDGADAEILKRIEDARAATWD